MLFSKWKKISEDVELIDEDIASRLTKTWTRFTGEWSPTSKLRGLILKHLAAAPFCFVEVLPASSQAVHFHAHIASMATWQGNPHLLPLDLHSAVTNDFSFNFLLGDAYRKWGQKGSF